MTRSKHGVLLWLLLQIFTNRSIFAEELTIDIDLEKPLAVTDDKFLSLTIDPAVLTRGAALSSDFERSIRLAHALTPAYVRFGGPGGTLYQSGSENPPDNNINRDHLISGSDWTLAYQWAEKAGLDVIGCISAENAAREEEKNSEEAVEIVSFSDQMGFNASWQLGYECQTRCNATAADLAKRFVNLRQTLNAYPRYENSMIIGPDIVAYKTKEERQYLEDYFNGAGNALSAITWHPEFDSITSDTEGVLIQPDDLEEDRKDLYKIIGRFMHNRPLWIAESKPEEYKSLYLGAMITARRLGNAARSKVDVIMRQPEDLTRPSPDYWVSLLHKTLVGRQVFDGTVDADDEIHHVYLYYQCTKPSDKYPAGSITIFGISFNPEDVEIRLKNTRITNLHEYLLSPGFDGTNRMFSESILLNNETLVLLNDEVPEMKPIISSNPEGLGISLPSAGIGFWVLPDFKVKSCLEPSLRVTVQPQQIKTHVTRSIREDEPTGMSKRRPKDERERKQPRIHRSRTRRPTASTPAPDSNTQSQLEEYKHRVSVLEKLLSSGRTRSAAKRVIHEVLEKSRSLISRVERARSPGAARDALRALGLLLSRVPFLELNFDGAPRTKRARRELFDEFLSAEEDLLRGGSGQSVKGRRSSQNCQMANEHFVDEIRPRILAPMGESGENTFYGFLRTDPAEGFPVGDVFFDTGDYQNFRDDRGSDPAEDYANPQGPGDSWMDDGGDYSFYEPREYYTSERRDEANPPGELWEAEDADYGRRRIDGASITSSNDDYRVQAARSGLSRLTGYYEAGQPTDFGVADGRLASGTGSRLSAGPSGFVDGRQTSLDYAPAEFPWDSRGVRRSKRRVVNSDRKMSILEPADSSLDGDERGVKRLKRKGMDLGLEMSILDQEMIKEDDANSKDCNCRVIRDHSRTGREKRDVDSGEVGTNVEILSEQDALASDAEAVPEEVEVFSELRDEPIANVEAGPPSSKLQRDAGAQGLIIQEDFSEPEAVAPRVSQVSAPLDDQTAEHRSLEHETVEHQTLEDHPEVLQVDDAGTTGSPMALSPESDGSESWGPVGREGRQFFREEGEKEEEEEEVHNLEHRQGVAARHMEDFPSEENARKASETIAATLDPVALYEEDVTEAPEDDHEESTVAKGGSKRQANAEAAANAEEGPENVKIEAPVGPRRIKTRLRNPVSDRKRTMGIQPWENRVMERARVMLSLKKAADERKRRKMESAGRVGAPANFRAAPKLDQTEKLKNKLKPGRQKLQKQVQRANPEEEDEEERKLDRREALQRLEGETDQGAMDPDRLRYMTMYEPKREGRSSERVDDKKDLSVAEIAKPRKPRERVLGLRDRGLSRDSGILEHSNPREMQERIIKLENVLKNGVRGRRCGNDRRYGQSYYALVESLEDPRFFYYPEEERGMQMQSYLSADSSEDPYDVQRYVSRLDNLEILDDSNEELEDSEEEEDSHALGGSREIYMIDPSTYRGGEPTLQLYRPPAKLGYPARSRLANYDRSWEPIFYKTERARQTAQRKREDRTEYPESSEAYDEEQSDRGLLSVLVKALDLPSAAELFRTLSREYEQKRNSMRSIKEKPFVESTVDDVDQSSGSSEAAAEVSEEDTDAEESHGDPLEDYSESNVRNRREASDYFEDSSRSTRKHPRDIEQSGGHNYVCLEESSEESPEDDSAEFVKISSKFRPGSSADESTGAKNSEEFAGDRGEQVEGHSDEDSFDYGSENVSDQEYYDSEQEESGERMDFQQVLQPNHPGLFMVVPWDRRLMRPRREAADLEKEEKQVQQLEASTTELPDNNETDEIEAMISKKIPPKKYSAAGSLFNYLTLKKNLRKGSKEDLPSLIEGSIPKVENVVVDSLRKAENLSGTVEQLIDDIEDRFDETTSAEDLQADDRSTGVTGYAFHSAITNAKKFFMMLAGITHALRG